MERRHRSTRPFSRESRRDHDHCRCQDRPASDSPDLGLPDGEGWVIVASRGGDTRLPGWYHNLRARPRATLQIGRKRLEVDAREATGEEHERLWEMVNNAYPGYAYYRERSGRHIPVVVLTPAGAGSTAAPAAESSPDG